MTDYAVRLFYLGEAYHGSQQQPHVRTVQGELIDALTSWSGTPHSPQSVKFSGRTDRGVHSIGQIVIISSDKAMDIDRVNKYLPEDIILWAVAESPSDFHPRFGALMRHYRYFLDSSWRSFNFDRVREVSSLLVGSYDFELLAKPEPGRNSISTVLNVNLSDSESVKFIDFFGISFLWKFVRKTVTILRDIGLGVADKSLVTGLLRGDQGVVRGGIEPAPPENLFLVETVVPFRLSDSKYALRKMRVCLRDRIAFHDRSLLSYSGAMKHFTA